MKSYEIVRNTKLKLYKIQHIPSGKYVAKKYKGYILTNRGSTWRYIPELTYFRTFKFPNMYGVKEFKLEQFRIIKFEAKQVASIDYCSRQNYIK